MPYNIIVGGRGRGKSFSAFYEMISEGRKFMYTRRTVKQINACASENGSLSLNPLIPINNVKGTDAHFIKMRCDVTMYAIQNHGKDIGLATSLKEFANIRGFTAEYITDWIFDEFIREKHEPKMRGEAEAFLNAYETINRNREFKGKPPLRVYLMSNSESLDSEILRYLNVTDVISKMKRRGETLKILPHRGIAINIPNDSDDFFDMKSNTALYKLVRGTAFEKVSLYNEFAYDDMCNVGSRPLQEYRFLCSVGDICIMRHKSKKEYYALRMCPPAGRSVFENTERGIREFQLKYGRGLNYYYLIGKLKFSTYSVKSDLTKIL